MQKLPLVLLFLVTSLAMAQTKVGGTVVDELGDPVAFANVLFKGTTEGTITNENGRFYLESEQTRDTLVISFVGYVTREIILDKRVNREMRVVLVAGEELDEVVVFMGKQPKKDNPAIDILRKIWAKKKENGLRKFNQYQYDEYEKIEFDLNTIDSALMKSRLFKGMEFVFEDMDTSRITGKTYLPIFINEKFSKVYGDNQLNEEKIIEIANELELNMDQFSKDRNLEASRQLIREDTEDGKRVGVRGTPSLFLNGKRVNNKQLGSLPKLITKELEKP